MPLIRVACFSLVFGLLVRSIRAQDASVVGEVSAGRVIIPTNQVLTPASRLMTFAGRPTDLVMLNDQRTVVVKTDLDNGQQDAARPFRKGEYALAPGPPRG
jgi:hypothetical protein